MLAKAGESSEPSSRRLYVFSDRTTTSWDADAAKRIHMPAGVRDCVHRPRRREAGGPGHRQGRGEADGRSARRRGERPCRGAGRRRRFRRQPPLPARRRGGLATRPVKLSADSRAPVGFDFKLKAPALVRPQGAEGVATEAHQIVVKFSAADDRPFQDALPHDNIRYATFFVRDDSKRQGRRVLVMEDDPNPAGELKVALTGTRPWTYHNRTPRAITATCGRRPTRRSCLKDLEPYRVVCLYQNAKPFPDEF